MSSEYWSHFSYIVRKKALAGLPYEIPTATEDTVKASELSAHINLRKPANNSYGVDILILRLCKRIRELERNTKGTFNE